MLWPLMPSTLLRPAQRIKRLAREQDLITRQLDEAQYGRDLAFLPIASIQESPEASNSRRGYDEGKLNELAASIQEHGVLQPILVALDGDAYQVIAGNRRLKAAFRAGLERIPAIIKPHLDENARFLVNLVENIQRVDLSPKERVEAIRQLAASGQGVREISRGTGLAPSTISRWIRIAGNEPVARAMEEGRVDIFRAMQLARIKDSAQIEQLIDVAADVTPNEFVALVQGVATSNTSYCLDDGRLADVDRKMALVREVTPVGLAHLQRIVARALDLIRRAENEASAASGTSLAEPAAIHVDAEEHQHGGEQLTMKRAARGRTREILAG
jgi:ParB family transcriptional regulator, chromosome partitioning protein